MDIQSALRAIAGEFVLISVALGVTVSPWFFAFTAFVGVNLLQSAFTQWCPMWSLLRKLGLPETRSESPVRFSEADQRGGPARPARSR